MLRTHLPVICNFDVTQTKKIQSSWLTPEVGLPSVLRNFFILVEKGLTYLFIIIKKEISVGPQVANTCWPRMNDLSY